MKAKHFSTFISHWMYVCLLAHVASNSIHYIECSASGKAGDAGDAGR